MNIILYSGHHFNLFQNELTYIFLSDQEPFNEKKTLDLLEKLNRLSYRALKNVTLVLAISVAMGKNTRKAVHK